MKKAMAALILFLMETLLFYLYEMQLEADRKQDVRSVKQIVIT